MNETPEKEKEIQFDYQYSARSEVDNVGQLELGAITGLNDKTKLILSADGEKFSLHKGEEFIASFAEWSQMIRFIYQEYCQLNEVMVHGGVQMMNTY